MFVKTAKRADDILGDVISFALDPKVIDYILKPHRKKKDKHGRYEIVKLSEVQPKAKSIVLKTPANKPTGSIASAINSEARPISTERIPTATATYHGLPPGKFVKATASATKPLESIVKQFAR